MSPIPGTELLPNQSVFRLVRLIPPRFVPEGKPGINGEDFAPSSDDKNDAKETNQPVRISVWETELTTVAEARSFRNVGETLAYRLHVSSVIELRAQFQDVAGLRVVADPLLNCTKAGADGHCGIEGLERPLNGSRKRYKELRDELALKAEKMSED
jgi:hypothetical protein